MLSRKLFLYLVAIVNCCSGELSDNSDNRENEISTGQLMQEFKIPKDTEATSDSNYGT